MSDYGIKVSVQGTDVNTATGDNLVLDTSYKNLKYVKNVYLSTAGQFAHGLGYTPVCWVWAQDAQGWWTKARAAFVPSTSGGTAPACIASADATNIYASAGYVEYLADQGYDDTTTTQTGDDTGMKISVSGKDVNTCVPYDTVFDSLFNTYKIYSSGTVTISWSEGQEGWKNVDVVHSLGYAPKVFVFDENGQEPAWTSSGYEGEETFNYFSNASVLRIVGDRYDPFGGELGPLPAYSQTFTYFICVDRIDDVEFV